jgi:uncharacterized membrane protein (UPF0127 family)
VIEKKQKCFLPGTFFKNRVLIEICFRFRQIQRMNFSKLFPLLLAANFLFGCAKTSVPAPTAAATNSPEVFIPTHAQSKLPTMKIFLGAETLDAELALTSEEEQTGMMFRTNILDSDSMLFVLPYTMRADFWMKNCPESISAAYITPDGVITEIHHLEKNDTNGVIAATDNVRFVLETSEGWFARHNVHEGQVIVTEKGSLAKTFLNGQ